MAPRDYKERPARSKKSRPKPARAAQTPRRGSAKGAQNVARWRWFGAGLCIGAVATAALFLYEPGTVRQVADGAGTVTDRADKPPRTRFEFYTLLPEKEMLIPESDIEESVPLAPTPVANSDVPVARASAPASEARGKYLLQVGSFRSLEDADRLKAKLAFLGLEGSIQTISINGRETWHRVRVGPYFARAQLDEAHAMLKANKYDVLLLKLKEQ